MSDYRDEELSDMHVYHICFYDIVTEKVLYHHKTKLHEVRWDDYDNPVGGGTVVSFLTKLWDESIKRYITNTIYKMSGVKERREYIVVVPIDNEKKLRFDLAEKL